MAIDTRLSPPLSLILPAGCGAAEFADAPSPPMPVGVVSLLVQEVVDRDDHFGRFEAVQNVDAALPSSPSSSG